MTLNSGALSTGDKIGQGVNLQREQSARCVECETTVMADCCFNESAVFTRKK